MLCCEVVGADINRKLARITLVVLLFFGHLNGTTLQHFCKGIGCTDLSDFKQIFIEVYLENP